MAVPDIAARLRRAACALGVALGSANAFAVTRIESWREYEKTRDYGAELRLLGLVAIGVAVTIWIAFRAQSLLDRRRP